MLVSDAQLELARSAEKGSNCPCCGQFVKRYKRKLTKTHVNYLLELYRIGKDDLERFIHVSELISKSKQFAKTFSGEFARLRHFGLIESGGDGNWRITRKGINFIDNKIEMPKYIKIYNNKVLGFSREMITVRQIL